MFHVVILGAGMVAKPIVRYLLSKNIQVTLADVNLSHASRLIEGHPLGTAVEIDAENDQKLISIITPADLVVSLLPFIYHVKIAKICISLRKNMVTSSYVKPEMRALDEEAKNAGILILNELGLDPGIDHMSAKKIIDAVHEKGGQIEEFYSFCGALPAPECTNNPFKYKFTWSPRGVLLAGNNSASYLNENKLIEVEEKNLFRDVRWINYEGLGTLEVYPNRDSLPYRDLYDIKEAKTIMRGTIRYPGWCRIIDSLKKLRLFSNDEISTKEKTYIDILTEKVASVKNEDTIAKICDFLGIRNDDEIIQALDYAGFLSRSKITQEYSNLFDLTADLMIPKMLISEKDRDMVVMQHIFKATYANGQSEYIHSKMLDFGSLAEDTAVARTVAYPAGIGVKLILENKINLKGVHIPVVKQVYDPILSELESLGIKLIETYGLKTSGIIYR